MSANLRGAMEKVEGDERPREKRKGWGGGVREEGRETEQAESRRPKGASAHKMRKWSGSQEARPPNLSLCRRTPHYRTSWALGVPFEVLWGTSSHETSIVNPLVNQVCSWAYVWSGSFSSEDSKRSKEIVAERKDEVSKISDKIRVQRCQNLHNIPNLLHGSAVHQHPAPSQLVWLHFKPIVIWSFPQLCKICPFENVLCALYRRYAQLIYST